MTTAIVTENPYKDLYIYYFSGRFRPDHRFQPADYLGCWEEGEFSFLFFHRPNPGAVARAIGLWPDLVLLDQYQMSYEQWHGDEIKPCRIGGFTVTPPWIDDQRTFSEPTIILDPGVVFGTGTHPTTRDCMEALELAMADQSVTTALDLGTGTGLLSLAAARLGCRKVLAMDLNLLAARTTKRNVQLNRLSDRILVAQGDAEKFMDFTSDLVISNIHYDVMKNLIRRKGFLLKRHFILSGLMRSEAAQIESTLADLPVRIVHRWHSEGTWEGTWHTIYGVAA